MVRVRVAKNILILIEDRIDTRTNARMTQVFTGARAAVRGVNCQRTPPADHQIVELKIKIKTLSPTVANRHNY